VREKEREIFAVPHAGNGIKDSTLLDLVKEIKPV
jgi:hypothetical protein